jgi:16S rRNA (cytosine1402-N4)-methyltransferase
MTSEEEREEGFHTPVLLAEVLEGLGCAPGGVYLDGTLGEGGHAEAILRASSPDGRLIGLDQDEEAVAFSKRRLEDFGERATLMHASFFNLGEIAEGLGIREVDGVLLDLGISSRQLAVPDRGFSFMKDGPLDMRMDRCRERTAADLVNRLSEAELEEILKVYGEERWARRIAQAVVRERSIHPITQTLSLSDIVKRAIPRRFQSPDRHPATRTFQALRIAVNEELEGLAEAIRQGVHLLKPGGRIGVISFHSLEDRIVKEVYGELGRGCVCPRSFPVCVCGRKSVLQRVTRKPVCPTSLEVSRNPRARSAKLRLAERRVS